MISIDIIIFMHAYTNDESFYHAEDVPDWASVVQLLFDEEEFLSAIKADYSVLRPKQKRVALSMYYL